MCVYIIISPYSISTLKKGFPSYLKVIYSRHTSVVVIKQLDQKPFNEGQDLFGV